MGKTVSVALMVPVADSGKDLAIGLGCELLVSAPLFA